MTYFCQSCDEGKNPGLAAAIFIDGAIHRRFGIRHTRKAAQCVLLLEAPSAGMLTPHRIDRRQLA